MMGFTNTDQPQVIAKYNDAFFASLHDVYKTSSYKLFKSYLHGLIPRKGEITDEMINKLSAYLGHATVNTGKPTTP